MDETPDTRTMHDLYQEAIVVQDACNLSGVVLGFSRAIRRLRQLTPDAGTDTINKHPLCVLWASKVASLTDCENHERFFSACDEAEKV